MGKKKIEEPSSDSTGTSTTPSATPPSNEEREEILTFVRKFFEPEHGGLGPELRPPIAVSAALITHVARTAGQLLNDEQLATASRLAGEWTAAVGRLHEYGRDKINTAMGTHHAEIAEAELAGQPLPDGWSRGDIAEDFAARRAALKEFCRDRSQKAGQLFMLASGKVVAALRAFAEEHAVKEFRDYAQFGVEYSPSRLTQTLLCAASRLELQAEKLAGNRSVLGTDPRTMFQTIGIEL